MDVFAGHRRLARPLRAPAVAIGNFDGVHLGHRALIDRARAAARELGGEAVALTFEPHPAQVLARQAPPRVATPARKLELLAEAGVDACVVEPFDTALASVSADEFVRGILAGALGARRIVVGRDFRFGRERAGDVGLLERLGGELRFAVDAIEAVQVDDRPVSSSRIRDLVAAGDVAGARRLLGRDFDVDGAVVRGAGRGRALGIPTANVALATELVPALGIYAVWLERAGERGARRAGAASVGTNPTFAEDGGRLSVEVHLLDFEGDLYGDQVRVRFVERLRGERRFDSTGALVEQIRRDIADARRILDGGAAAPEVGR